MTAVQPTPEQAKSIGDLLKTTRENQGKNISDVAYQIALSPAQLRAIESADLKPFYSPNFFYQAAERYAHFLNVSLPKFAPAAKPEPEDTEAATTQAPQEEAPVIKAPALPAAEKTATTIQPPPNQVDSPRRSRWKPIGLAAAVAVIAITLFVDQKSSVNTTPADNTANASSNTTAASEAASTTSANTPASTAALAVVASGQTASAPANPPAAVTTKPAASPPSAPEQNDSRLESATTAWVQIVQKNGEKTNLKIEPGQKIEFTAANTAAIVFGQPDKAKLLVKGKAVDINRFVTADNPSRALVILNQLP